ncbi:MAG TPA: lipopolysaccharide transport periplasmic protein LptA [Candidatus Deferrimicrobiaceae bacterium]
MRKAFVLAPAILLAVLVASGLAADGKGKLPRSSDQGALPIEITADRLSADNAKNSVTFEGTVHAKQGDVTLHADKIYAEYSKSVGAIEKIVADGNVRVTQPGRSATSARAVFYNLEQRIVLSGNTVLTQGENTLKGETVTIFLRENRSVVSGGEGGGRVSGVIYPKGLVDVKENPGK